MEKHFNLMNISWKNIMKIVTQGIFFQLMFIIPKNDINLTMIFHFFLWKNDSWKGWKTYRYIIWKKYLVHIQTLKQGLNHGLVLKILHRVIKFNQKAWLKHDKWIWKIFFKLMNNEVFVKSLENIRKQR